MIKVSYAVVPFVVVIGMKLLVKALKVEKANEKWDAEHETQNNRDRD